VTSVSPAANLSTFASVERSRRRFRSLVPLPVLREGLREGDFGLLTVYVTRNHLTPASPDYRERSSFAFLTPRKFPPLAAVYFPASNALVVSNALAIFSNTP
jgi:hypothetical protein